MNDWNYFSKCCREFWSLFPHNKNNIQQLQLSTMFLLVKHFLSMVCNWKCSKMFSIATTCLNMPQQHASTFSICNERSFIKHFIIASFEVLKSKPKLEIDSDETDRNASLISTNTLKSFYWFLIRWTRNLHRTKSTLVTLQDLCAK